MRRSRFRVKAAVTISASVDSLGVTRWKEQHPKLTPIYERLDLFSVFDSAWFSAIYILLMVSLVGCFVPRILVYWRGLRAQPPAAPRHSTRSSRCGTSSAKREAEGGSGRC